MSTKRGSPNRGGVGHTEVDHTGVGRIIQWWGGSYRSGWIMQGGVSHAVVGWGIRGGMGCVM